MEIILEHQKFEQTKIHSILYGGVGMLENIVKQVLMLNNSANRAYKSKKVVGYGEYQCSTKYRKFDILHSFASGICKIVT